MQKKLAAIAIGQVVIALAVGIFIWRRSGNGDAEERKVTPAWESSPKDERCTTCHQKAHPALPAKHELDRLGCTVCHGGDGASAKIDAHRGRHEAHAGCGTCHANDEVSPELAKGRAIFRRERCAACHAVARAEPLRFAGPPLDGIGARTTPEHVLALLRAEAGAMPSFWPPPRDPATRAPLAAGTPGHDAWLARRQSETLSITAYLFDRDDGKLADSIARRANVTGASAEEGKKLFDAIGCAQCHAAASFVGLREDWIAWFLEDPARAHPRTTMPSFRLDRREAASLAKLLAQRAAPKDLPADELAIVTDPARRRERVKCNMGQPEEMTRAKCGELLFDAYGCGSCHGGKALALPLDGYASRVPAEKDWGQVPPDAAHAWDTYTSIVLEAPRVFAPASRRMPEHRLAPDEIASMRIYLASLSGRTPIADFDPSAHDVPARGAILAGDLACASCHEKNIGPSLKLEGARVRASWITTYLKDPGAHGVRPPLHPEWVWGSLVPLDKLAPRMPTYALELTEIEKLLASMGASEPTSEARTPAPKSPNATVALRPCLRCHYAGELPVDRAKTSLADLAPDLSTAPARLRPDWVRSFLSSPRGLVPHTTLEGADPALLAPLLLSPRSSP